MLNRFYILGCCLFLVQLVHGQHLQLIENRGEIGFYGGRSGYIGDLAPDILTYNYLGGLYYKKQYNDYAGFKLNYEKIQLVANDTISKNIYVKRRGMRFSRDFHDLSFTGEFYFTKYLPGNKGYRFTPYLGIGIGYLLPTSDGYRQALYTTTTPSSVDSISLPFIKDSKKGYLNIPIQLGFKYNLSQRWNVFAEGMFRFVQSDELDFFPDAALLVQTQKVASVPIAATPITYSYQGSRSGKDQFFSIKAGFSYNLIKIYGEEKWKPGKKSKLASLKEKEASQKKPGFFSRLKFKRK